MTRRGKENPNWRGGRTISSHGYILIRVGTDHHLADVRGYAYEHRLVAERKLGRCLMPGEMVHHLNGNKQDNQPENLSVVSSLAEHYMHHRKRQDLRRPGELNSVIECKCGCGLAFKKYDTCGRPRQYVSGHNPFPAPAQQEILRILGLGALHRQKIANLCEKSVCNIATCLSILKKQGLVKQVSRGIWALREATNG